MITPTRRLRFRFQWRAVLLLALVWVMLWGNPSLLNILYGLVLGWLVTVVFWLPPIRYYGRVHPGRLLVLVLAQLRDLAVAAVQLAAVSFRRRVDLHPGIIRVELRSNNDLYQVMVAQLISIVPGTLVVETSRHPRLLYLHVFDLPDEHAIEHERSHALAIERRLVRAFGSAADIKAVS
ncbi:MAG: Na+/H+ antiporter subunit E [Propionicimonas sp.]|uniref:Na+/H+ antiporter subunit E n=1 Tax=Propionicimonas sp. TaxID=1955623 RepID=UPI003D124BFF